MSNAYDEVRVMVAQAHDVKAAFGVQADRMAEFLEGNLRSVSNGHRLARLKRELQKFDATTKRWKS